MKQNNDKWPNLSVHGVACSRPIKISSAYETRDLGLMTGNKMVSTMELHLNGIRYNGQPCRIMPSNFKMIIKRLQIQTNHKNRLL